MTTNWRLCPVCDGDGSGPNPYHSNCAAAPWHVQIGFMIDALEAFEERSDKYLARAERAEAEVAEWRDWFERTSYSMDDLSAALGLGDEVDPAREITLAVECPYCGQMTRGTHPCPPAHEPGSLLP